MAAFDKIRSGFEGLDEMLDSIRLGDNVVWQVQTVEDFRIFAEPFVRQAVEETGWLGIFTGGFTAGAAGVAAAVLFGYLAALCSRSGDKA